jgi:hypothetical protein
VHGGDPRSIAFCHKIGMDYVSCSAYQIPIARLAAAQVAIENPVKAPAKAKAKAKAKAPAVKSAAAKKKTPVKVAKKAVAAKRK